MNELPQVTIVDREVASDMLTAHMYQPSDLSCVLSINDTRDHEPVGFHEFSGHKLAVFFDDVLANKYGYIPADLSDVRRVIAWARGVKGPCLIHCAAGVSRSTACALAIPSVHRPQRDAETAADLMRWLVGVRYVAKPNPLIVALIDAELGWNGVLSEARMWRFGDPWP